jgi:hypothetical protein
VRGGVAAFTAPGAGGAPEDKLATLQRSRSETRELKAIVGAQMAAAARTSHGVDDVAVAEG